MEQLLTTKRKMDITVGRAALSQSDTSDEFDDR
jgi:hypothetical protein